MHLAMLTAFSLRRLVSSWFGFVASVEIDGSFGAVPRDGLMSPLWELGADAH